MWPSPGATDALVSDEVALSGENSLKLESTDLIGGPTDVVLFAGLIGAYEVTFNVHVPAGNSGYYNVQGSITMGEIWSFEGMFASDGTFGVVIDDETVLTFQ